MNNCVCLILVKKIKFPRKQGIMYAKFYFYYFKMKEDVRSLKKFFRKLEKTCFLIMFSNFETNVVCFLSTRALPNLANFKNKPPKNQRLCLYVETLSRKIVQNYSKYSASNKRKVFTCSCSAPILFSSYFVGKMG
jgi:hypothetical protein